VTDVAAAVRDEWLAIALATGPADRPTAEAGVRTAYEQAGLAPPEAVIWLDSPLQAAYAVAMLRLATRQDLHGRLAGAVADDPVWNQVWELVDPPALGDIGDPVRYKVSADPLYQIHRLRVMTGGDAMLDLLDVRQVIFARAWTNVGAPIQARIADLIGPKVWGPVWPELRDMFHGHVLLSDMIKDYSLEEYFIRIPAELSRLHWHFEWEEPFSSLVGQHSAAELAVHDGLVRHGIAVDVRVDGLVQVARSAGVWYPFERAVVLTERPSELHLDADGRLHHPSGPAALYPDGFRY